MLRMFFGHTLASIGALIGFLPGIAFAADPPADPGSVEKQVMESIQRIKDVSENKFVDRIMASHLFPLPNKDFEDSEWDGPDTAFPGWNAVAEKKPILRIRKGEGKDSPTSLALISPPESGQNPEGLWTALEVPSSWQSEIVNISMSAWVWSDTPASTYLKIEANDKRHSKSAFHPGNSRWEYLTVVLPGKGSIQDLKLSLLHSAGEARFDSVQPVFIKDDRFPTFKGGIIDHTTFRKTGKTNPGPEWPKNSTCTTRSWGKKSKITHSIKGFAITSIPST